MWDTKVSYCQATYRMWSGCTKVSPGCEHCHDERLAHRFTSTWGAEWGPGKPRKRMSELYRRQPLAWNRRAEKEGTRPRVLTLGGDPFDPEVPLKWFGDFVLLTEQTPNLDWLVLTKRIAGLRINGIKWSDNVWLGLTVCNQAEADANIPILLSIPATKHWISYEPALGPVLFDQTWYKDIPGISWIVCGCESGPGHRPMYIDWARDVRDQCQAAKVPFYLKQMMINGKLVHNPELDGQRWEQIPE